MADGKASTVKAVLVGDGGIGKTTFCITQTTGKFPKEFVPTVFDIRECDVKSKGKSFKLCFWDTAGREDYDRIRPLSYPGTNVFLVGFDIANHCSLDNVRTKWIPEIANHCPGVPFILVGMKSDLRENEKIKQRLQERNESPVTFDEGTRMAVEIGATKYMECSSLQNKGLTEAVDALSEVGSQHLLKSKKKKRKCIMM
eukprot:jgi/Bigna1/55382/estExt_Genewise1Plus.C_580016